MRLYHFTAPTTCHAGAIISDGRINCTESNIGSPVAKWPPTGEHVGPDVVWLTTSPYFSASSHGLGVEGSPIKAAARFTVDVEDAEPWSSFARRHGMNKQWRRHLEKDRVPSTWYVVERPIPAVEWVELHWWDLDSAEWVPADERTTWINPEDLGWVNINPEDLADGGYFMPEA